MNVRMVSKQPLQNAYVLQHFRGWIKCIILLGLVLPFIVGCVTTSDNRFNKKADKGKALQNYVTVALTYIQKNNLPRAKRAASRALEIDDDFAPAHDAMALIMQKEGEIALADQHFKRAVRLDSGFSRARSHYGAFLYVHKRYEEAYKHLEIAASDVYYESRPLAYENLALCALKLDRTDEAVKAYRKAVQLNPAQPRPLIGLSQIYIDQEDVRNATSTYRIFLQHVRNKNAAQTAKTLWLGVQIALLNQDEDTAASYGLILRNNHGGSKEYKAYKTSLAKRIAADRNRKEEQERSANNEDRLLEDPSDIVVAPRPIVIKKQPVAMPSEEAVLNNQNSKASDSVTQQPNVQPKELNPERIKPNIEPKKDFDLDAEDQLLPIDIPYKEEKASKSI